MVPQGEDSEPDGAAPGGSNESNLNWLSQILWSGPPPDVKHLRKYRPDSQPVAVSLPADLIEEDFEIDEIEIFGVPDGASLNAGEEIAPGVWKLQSDDLDSLALNPPVPPSGPADLTVMVVEREQGENETVTNMAPVRIDLPGTPPGTGDVTSQPDQVERMTDVGLSIDQFDSIRRRTPLEELSKSSEVIDAPPVAPESSETDRAPDPKPEAAADEAAAPVSADPAAAAALMEVVLPKADDTPVVDTESVPEPDAEPETPSKQQPAAIEVQSEPVPQPEKPALNVALKPLAETEPVQSEEKPALNLALKSTAPPEPAQPVEKPALSVALKPSAPPKPSQPAEKPALNVALRAATPSEPAQPEKKPALNVALKPAAMPKPQAAEKPALNVALKPGAPAKPPPPQAKKPELRLFQD